MLCAILELRQLFSHSHSLSQPLLKLSLSLLLSLSRDRRPTTWPGSPSSPPFLLLYGIIMTRRRAAWHDRSYAYVHYNKLVGSPLHFSVQFRKGQLARSLDSNKPRCPVRLPSLSLPVGGHQQHQQQHLGGREEEGERMVRSALCWEGRIRIGQRRAEHSAIADRSRQGRVHCGGRAGGAARRGRRGGSPSGQTQQRRPWRWRRRRRRRR